MTNINEILSQDFIAKEDMAKIVQNVSWNQNSDKTTQEELAKLSRDHVWVDWADHLSNNYERISKPTYIMNHEKFSLQSLIVALCDTINFEGFERSTFTDYLKKGQIPYKSFYDSSFGVVLIGQSRQPRVYTRPRFFLSWHNPYAVLYVDKTVDKTEFLTWVKNNKPRARRA